MLQVTLLASLLAGSQMFYVANTTTFACTSADEVVKLQHMRPARKAFHEELYREIFAGECVEIPKGKVVEGAIHDGDSAVLLVDRTVQPPGFLSPVRDFRKWNPPRNARVVPVPR
jgi:hypothetical protein